METEKLKIAICGGGNGAHCFATIASSRNNVEVNVLSVYKDEAERWVKATKDNMLTAFTTDSDGTTTNVSAKPSLITKEPAIALKGTKIIFIVVPAYVHQIYLEIIYPYVQPDTLIVGLPGHPGFELQCKNVLKEKAKTCTMMGFESLPWACRITEYGKRVQLLGYKDILSTSLLTGRGCKLPFPAVETVQRILGDKPRINIAKNAISITLKSGSVLHPPIMYGKWKDWDGVPLNEKPLFYQGVTEMQTNLMSCLNREIRITAKKIQELKPSLVMTDVVTMEEWFKTHYSDTISDTSSLLTLLRTNSAYQGLVHPMKRLETGFVPDFDYRYITEDIPFGIVILKGIAILVGVATPTMDELINWAQKILGKEYLVDSKLKGKDVKSVRAPQSYGISTLDQLVEYFDSDMIYEQF